MSEEIVKHGDARSDARSDAGTLAAGVTGAVALVLCCGGGLIAVALGLGALAAFLVNPWFLFPVVLITAGTVYWRTNRTAIACDVEPHQMRDR